MRKVLFPPRIGISLLLGFLLRISIPIFAWCRNKSSIGFYSYDTASYINPAREWLFTGRFTNGGEAEVFRTPGYPALLIPGIFVNQIEFVTIGLQIGLGVVSIFLIYLIALRLFDNKKEIAETCAFFYSIEPLSILYGSKLLSETFFTAVLLVLLFFLINYLNHRKIINLVIVAVFLATLVYIRPIAYYLPIYLVVVILLSYLISKQFAFRQLLQLFSLLIISYGLIGLWQWRNYNQTGYSGFSIVSDINTYFFHGASVLAVTRGIPLYEMQNQMGYRDESVYDQLHPDQQDWPISQKYTFLRSEGSRIVLANLPTYGLIYFIGLARTLLDPSAIEYLRLFDAYPLGGGLFGVVIDRGLSQTASGILNLFQLYPQLLISFIILAIIQIGLYIFAITGVFQPQLWKNRIAMIVLSVGFYFLLLAGGPLAADRFRQPIMPFVCLLAGYGLCIFVSKRKSDRQKG